MAENYVDEIRKGGGPRRNLYTDLISLDFVLGEALK